MKYVVANWKMNPTKLLDAERLLSNIEKHLPGGTKKERIIVAAPFLFLHPLAHIANKVSLAAQNVFWEQSGAFTGEISPEMLRHLGLKYVMVGHSERRLHNMEDQKVINRKVDAALAAGLRPILAVGTTKRTVSAATLELRAQLRHVSRISPAKRARLLIAFEPLFAIGSGKPADPDYVAMVAQKIHRIIDVPVLYGGSVDDATAHEYLKQKSVAGVLVGSASLNAKTFASIVWAAQKS